MTIVELLVASLLGLLIVGAVIGLFLSSRTALSQSEQVSALFDNARHGITVLSDDLRLVDFWGASKVSDIVNDGNLDAISSDCSGAAAGYSISNAIWATTATSANVATCITDAVVNSDVMVIKHVAPQSTAAGALDINLTYLMANEAKGIIFDAADVAPTTSTGGAVPNGKAWAYIATLYYVANNGRGVPMLFRRRLTGNTWGANEEVAAGIERMRVTVGIDTNNDATADFWTNAAGANWSQAVAIKVHLLARSENSDLQYTDTRTYNLGDLSVDPSPDDHFRRAVIETSANLRNRQLLINGGY